LAAHRGESKVFSVNFLVFVCLKVMDAFTTLLFLHYGAGEANPPIGAALTVFRNPPLAPTAAKVFAIGLAFYAWRSGRRGLLLRMNVLYACLRAGSRCGSRLRVVAASISGLLPGWNYDRRNGATFSPARTTEAPKRSPRA
jgi:hypothetical protein